MTARRRGGREAEGTRPESAQRREALAGSNPAPSAPTREELAAAVVRVMGTNPGHVIIGAQVVARMTPRQQRAFVAGDVSAFRDGAYKQIREDVKEQRMQQLEVWTVYENPSDHPGKFVARRFELEVPTRDVRIADTLDGVRALLPRGLIRMDRMPGDDPVIVEVWL